MAKMAKMVKLAKMVKIAKIAKMAKMAKKCKNGQNDLRSLIVDAGWQRVREAKKWEKWSRKSDFRFEVHMI